METILDRLSPEHKKFSKKQVEIARFIRTHLDEVCFMPLKELAAAAGTTETTVLGFCRKIGFTSFLGFKRELQQYVGFYLAPNDKISQSLEKIESSNALFRTLVEAEDECLRETLRHLDQGGLERFVDELIRAECVHVFAHGTSTLIGDFFYMRLLQTGTRAAQPNILDDFQVANSVLHAGEGDVFLLIAFPAYAKETISLANYLRRRGRSYLCVTDSVSSPLICETCVPLLCQSAHPIFHNSPLAAIAAADIAVSLLVNQKREQFVQFDRAYKELFENSVSSPSKIVRYLEE